MKDPVCGMEVSEPPKIHAIWQGRTFGFCARRCLARFEEDPARYAVPPAPVRPDEPASFWPLAGIFAAVLLFVFFKKYWMHQKTFADGMYDFMAGFFIVFGSFKLLDWKGFAEAYAAYDFLAARSRFYGFIYPLLELGLGIFYLLRLNLTVVNWVTLVLMTAGSLGVAKALLQKKSIRCACLGTRIRLPMTSVTLIEDLSMAAMAAWMLGCR